LRLGCIADDFTGATDLASVLRRVGYSTRIYFGLPEGTTPAEVNALVVALKTRTAPVNAAVELAQQVHRWMSEQNVSKYFIKYCSTMDSTDSGNIGPTIDAVMELEDEKISIVVPSYPDNGRTVSGGMLYVNGTPLGQSTMRDHPLTPMKNSHIADILRPQTSAQIVNVTVDDVYTGVAHSLIDSLRDKADCSLIAVDATTNEDILALRSIVSELKVITGGAALGQALVQPAETPTALDRLYQVSQGRRLIISGSASSATQSQVRYAKEHMTALRVDPEVPWHVQLPKLAYAAVNAWESEPMQPVLVYATSDLSDVKTENASKVEETLAMLATHLVSKEGARQLIVAGGETSGAVVQALGIRHLDLGPEIAPGVVWGVGKTPDGVVMNVALKSGNFGNKDMFTSAWDLLK
jgi:uncharacterized protein YgbK (DUF1537 family)